MYKQVLDIFNMCLKQEKTIVDSIYECTMQWYVAKRKQNQLNLFLFMHLVVIHWKHTRHKETIHSKTRSRKHAEMYICPPPPPPPPPHTHTHTHSQSQTYSYITPPPLAHDPIYILLHMSNTFHAPMYLLCMSCWHPWVTVINSQKTIRLNWKEYYTRVFLNTYITV